MPRPRRPGAPEPKRRSRKGCWPCKARKVKCGEEKPHCLNCRRQGENCDYNIRLNWGGRTKQASIDSSTPQSSGYGDTIIGHADQSPISTANTSPISTVNLAQLPPSLRKISPDAFAKDGREEMGSPEAISPSTPATFSVFDSPLPHSGSEGVVSPLQPEAQLSSTLIETPPLASSITTRSLANYFGQSHQNSSAHAPCEASSLPSLSAFAFHSNSVSQPTSFLRNSVGVPSQLLDSSSVQSQIDTQSRPGKQPSQAGDVLGIRMNDIVLENSNPRAFSDTGELPTLLLDSQSAQARRSNAGASQVNLEVKNGRTSYEATVAQKKWELYLNSVTDNYGLDCGRPDKDLALNNDHAAIELDPASLQRKIENNISPPRTSQADFEGYYAGPVPIDIPRSLSPLPSTLLENPINLMYFHHFLNHTSKMLVPHDCEDNPFVFVLPSMAIGDPNLLNLLLAYSASHRARYLGHPEPANRIAHWVRDVFPNLRFALEASHEEITDSHLAAAILLLSLKIVSPSTFEVPITWQSHLKLARDLFSARSARMAHHGNKVGAFLARWLGYIDTMGALSCRQAGAPLTLYHSVLAACCGPDNHDEFGVDCFTGFTPCTGLFLTRLAQLVQDCDNQRFDGFGNFRPEWNPSADIVMEAQAVLDKIDGLSEHAHVNPNRHRGIDCQDMMAIEEGFRYAGVVHLHRRVLGSPPDSFPVKEALRKLMSALAKMRFGASTEVCALLPLFTAGCETCDPTERVKLLGRFFVLEKSGLKQIQNARQLMQHCWDESLPWVALARGEFLG